VDSVKDRKNAFKIIGKRNLKITYKPENGSLAIITAMVTGERIPHGYFVNAKNKSVDI
jgi:hypothetical protein